MKWNTKVNLHTNQIISTRSVKNGTFEVIEPMDSYAEECEIIQSSGAFDVFGQVRKLISLYSVF